MQVAVFTGLRFCLKNEAKPDKKEGEAKSRSGPLPSPDQPESLFALRFANGQQ
jgi:hypothetical protein